MARQPRLEFAGVIYHVISRGNYRKALFEGVSSALRDDDGIRQQILTNCNGDTRSPSAAACLYWPDGQLAAKRILSTENTESTETGIQKVSNPPATPSPINAQPSISETFLWDGLALLRRNKTLYIIEPHPSGGSVIASHPVGKPKELTYYLNDILGTTLATVEAGFTTFASLTAFGQPLKLASNIPQPTNLATTNNPPNPLPTTPNLPNNP